MTAIRHLLRTILFICIGSSVSYPEKQTLNQIERETRPAVSTSDSGYTTFTLRHIHGTSNTSRIVFSDVHTPRPLHSLPGSYNEHLNDNTAAGHGAAGRNEVADLDDSELWAPFTVRLSTTKLTTHRPRVSLDAFNQARFTRSSVPWEEDEVVGPNVTSREVLLELAKMTSNAYYAVPGTELWYDLGSNWNKSYPFGWEPDENGLRGQIFVSSDNNTVIVSLKGTSVPYVGDGGPTIGNDKLNDNLLFSCCCAKVGWTWTPVCDCYGGGRKCSRNCVEDNLTNDSLYYPIAVNLYNNVSYMYPDANIWLTGHSLGGAIASLVGITFGAPVVAFEAPGERMASQRLHLPSPPSTQHVTHVYHTADPVPMGVCNGLFSWCSTTGYAFETRCHLGNSIIYDTVTKLGWSVSLTSHRILVIIEQLLNLTDWEVPVAAPENVDCATECYSWEFGDY